MDDNLLTKHHILASVFYQETKFVRNVVVVELARVPDRLEPELGDVDGVGEDLGLHGEGPVLLVERVLLSRQNVVLPSRQKVS